MLKFQTNYDHLHIGAQKQKFNNNVLAQKGSRYCDGWIELDKFI